MEYIKRGAEYLGLIKKPRETSIGKDLPHSVPATRDEALANLKYVELELHRAYGSITMLDPIAPDPDEKTALQVILEHWTIPLVKMAIKSLDEANCQALAQTAAGTLTAINPYCERHWDFSDSKVSREMSEGAKQAGLSTVKLGKVVTRLDPGVTCEGCRENASQLLSSLEQASYS